MELFAKKKRKRLAPAEEQIPAVKTMKQFKKELNDKHPQPEQSFIDRVKRVFGSMFVK